MVRALLRVHFEVDSADRGRLALVAVGNQFVAGDARVALVHIVLLTLASKKFSLGPAWVAGAPACEV